MDGTPTPGGRHDTLGSGVRRSGSAFDPGAVTGIVRERWLQDFDGNCATEPRVTSEINFAHPAGTKRAENLVGAEAATGRKRHGAIELCVRLSGPLCAERPSHHATAELDHGIATMTAALKLPSDFPRYFGISRSVKGLARPAEFLVPGW